MRMTPGALAGEALEAIQTDAEIKLLEKLSQHCNGGGAATRTCPETFQTACPETLEL